MQTSFSSLLVVGVITAVTPGAEADERIVEVYTDLGPIDIVVGPGHADERFVLFSPAVLPVAPADGHFGSQLRYVRQDVAAEAALQTA